jgi:hypothetical protein
LIEFGIQYPSKITKTLALPRHADRSRADLQKALQKALQETVKDSEFIAEADKAKIGLAPVTADDMRKTVETTVSDSIAFCQVPRIESQSQVVPSMSPLSATMRMSAVPL